MENPRPPTHHVQHISARMIPLSNYVEHCPPPNSGAHSISSAGPTLSKVHEAFRWPSCPSHAPRFWQPAGRARRMPCARCAKANGLLPCGSQPNPNQMRNPWIDQPTLSKAMEKERSGTPSSLHFNGPSPLKAQTRNQLVEPTELPHALSKETQSFNDEILEGSLTGSR